MAATALKQTRLLAIFALGAMLLSGTGLPALAFSWPGQNTTTIEGPGFKTQSHRGLFGSSSQSYQDALGNRIGYEKGWLGGTTTDTGIMGARLKKSRFRTEVTAPNGAPIVEQKRGWFGGKETHINTNSLFPLFTSFPGLFNSAPAQTPRTVPQSTLPSQITPGVFSHPVPSYQVFPTQSYANSFQPASLTIPNGLNQGVPFINQAPTSVAVPVNYSY